MMRGSAVIHRGQLVSEKRSNMYRPIGKIFEGFDANRIEERVGGKVSVVPIVRPDHSKVEGRCMVEDRVFDA